MLPRDSRTGRRPSRRWQPTPTRTAPFEKGHGRGITRGLVVIVIATLGFLLSILAVWMTGLLLRTKPGSPATRPTTTPTPDATTTPTTTAATQSQSPLSYLELVRDNHPDAEELRPLAERSELVDAARLFIRQPVMIDERGDLWIADPRGEELPAALRRGSSEREHVVNELPTQVLSWWRGGVASSAALVPRDGQALAILSSGRQVKLPIPSDALQRMIVGRDWRLFLGERGAFALKPETMEVRSWPQEPGEQWQSALFDARGFLAWSERRVARFVEGSWTIVRELPPGHRLLQVIPLRDGVARLVANNDADEAVIESLVLDPLPVDEATVERLVAELSSPEGHRRDEAQRELRQLGPLAWPVLERLLPAQLPEARVRMESLLSEKTEPTIGGFRPRPGPIRLFQRWQDGSVVLRAPQGWSQVGAGGERPVLVRFVWIRPGAVPVLAPDDIDEQIEEGATLDSVGDEIVAQTGRGLLRRVGGRFVPVLPRRLADYSMLRGIDARGRWLIASTKPDAPLLLLDPQLPDPVPRLPTWSIPVPAGGEIGRTTEGWVVMRSGSAWALQESGWRVVADGNAWRAVSPRQGDDASPITVDLPGGRTRLVMDEPGTLRRMQRVGGETRELATHTRGLLPGRWPDAMWLDPAGRLILAYLPSEIVVAFPQGRVPREIASLVPARTGDDEEE